MPASPNSLLSRSARNAGTESFYLTSDPDGRARARKKEEEKGGGEHTLARATKREKKIREKGKKKKREKEKGKTSTNRCRWRLREYASRSTLSRRGVATPGVVSSTACAVTLARNSSPSRACTCSAPGRTFSPPELSSFISYE